MIRWPLPVALALSGANLAQAQRTEVVPWAQAGATEGRLTDTVAQDALRAVNDGLGRGHLAVRPTVALRPCH